MLQVVGWRLLGREMDGWRRIGGGIGSEGVKRRRDAGSGCKSWLLLGLKGWWC